MTTDYLEFTLLGTGSSGGVPRVGNDWGDCDPAEPKNRRLRCSALCEVFRNGHNEPTRVLIDTSPDLRAQLLAKGTARLDAVFMTHDHADQTHGIDDVRALVLRSREPLDVHMDEFTAGSMMPKFRYCFEGKGGYPAILSVQPYLEPLKPRRVTGPGGDVEILPLEQQHGRIKSLGFRMDDLAYCNDVSGLPDESLEALSGLDVLIVDALRYTPHPTHAHLDQSLEWIAHLKPRRAVLTNLHIDMDYQTLLRELPEGVEPGYDGMVVRTTI